MPNTEKRMSRRRLGDILCERTNLCPETVDQIVSQQGQGSLLGELLLQRGLVDRHDLIAALEQVTHSHYVDAAVVQPQPSALQLLPRAVAVKYCALPLQADSRNLTILMAEPQNLRLLDELRFSCGRNISPRLGLRNEILEAIDRHYPAEPIAASPLDSFPDEPDLASMQFFTASSSERNKAAMEEFAAELRHQSTPAVRLVSSILWAASSRNASDIHIEPQALGALVRIRVDGVLRELMQIPPALVSFVISRVKILADLDIAERRLPQDGRFLVQVGKTPRERKLDLRVSTLPTRDGEKVVIRLLDSAATRAGFLELGCSPQVAEGLHTLLHQPQGTILVCGPTGSGKTTTLYSALNLRRSPGVNIVTIEDPVEYRIEGINQVQINPRQGLHFANCLRSILRQDPNIIMVGEIRDCETAEIALQCAQTGHLVLSTLHTTDSVSTITRLLDLGIPAFLIACSLNGILSQRLVRKLCECRDEVALPADYCERLKTLGVFDFQNESGSYGGTMFRAVGCAQCDNTGYKGRTGIYEVLVFDEALRAAIRTGAHAGAVRDLARAAGMRLMAEDAFTKARSGITSLEEVFRVVPLDTPLGSPQSLACPACKKSVAPAFDFCPYCGLPFDRQRAGTSSPASPARILAATRG
jgi:type IV pilus assembly protein PilB